ncbi:patatin-like phospholipase family protein [Sanyastnella coralliicola]|uniref:patatin-like phospholipase family protein n=1 Tax=Sanyastnella coralliicola TaxID=3069118 RepID=UPI0027B9FD91|nr:patatin-like phospholipase family protein [Longitalea sp. SCSIO 12813]
MKALFLPGGGTKIAGILGAAECVVKRHKFKPDVVAGLSAGAILTPVVALDRFEKAKEVIFDLKVKDFFECPPVKDNGKMTATAVYRGLRGKHSLGIMGSAFEKTLAKVIDWKTWEFDIATSGVEAFCQTVNASDGTAVLHSLNRMSDFRAIKAILSSASIPVFAEGADGEDFSFWTSGLHLDGGLRNHTPSTRVLESFDQPYSEVVSIYSRPVSFINAIDHTWEPGNVLDIAERSLEILMMEVSKRDAEREREICEKKRIPLTQIFLDLPQNGFYDTDNLGRSYQDGFKQAEEAMSRRKEGAV